MRAVTYEAKDQDQIRSLYSEVFKLRLSAGDLEADN